MKKSESDRITRKERREILKENDIHGKAWDQIHGGYFSSPEIAGNFLRDVEESLTNDRPDVLVDLGGGTGFILGEIIRRNPRLAIHFVNVDLSGKQLHHEHDGRIQVLGQSIADFTRRDIDLPSQHFFFIMRSVLHYFGREGFLPLLHHLRSQMQPGEFFIHQTACFRSSADASFMNLLYARMNTGKWYPTIGKLNLALRKTGFHVHGVHPAPPLPLTSPDLARRYGLTGTVLHDIQRELLERSEEKKGLFTSSGEGFCACLHYSIFVCEAVSPHP